MIPVTPALSIDESEISERFVRASGPGGQNVNKVASAVQLRFDARHSPSLPEAVRQRLAPQGDVRLHVLPERQAFAAFPWLEMPALQQLQRVVG